MNSDTVAASLTVLVLGMLVAAVQRKRSESSPGFRLRRLIAQRPDYLVFVGVPISSPARWAVATSEGRNCLRVEGEGLVSTSKVKAFTVAYPNHQLVEHDTHGLPLPDGVMATWSASREDFDTLQEQDIERGRAFLRISHAGRSSDAEGRDCFATTLRNISSERIRVLRFAGYAKTGTSWSLDTVTGQFFSAGEFQAWYGLGSREWIEPGEAVVDHNNYGAPPSLWAYYCESSSGEQFIAGEVRRGGLLDLFRNVGNHRSPPSGEAEFEDEPPTTSFTAHTLALTVWRDSVGAADDCDAPHELRLSLSSDTTIDQLLAILSEGSYLPPVEGGKASWVVECATGALAVISQQWDRQRFLVAPESPLAQLIASDSEPHVFIRYRCQDDPAQLVDALRAGRSVGKQTAQWPWPPKNTIWSAGPES